MKDIKSPSNISTTPEDLAFDTTKRKSVVLETSNINEIYNQTKLEDRVNMLVTQFSDVITDHQNDDMKNLTREEIINTISPRGILNEIRERLLAEINNEENDDYFIKEKYVKSWMPYFTPKPPIE